MIDFVNSDKTVIIAELSCNHIQSFDIAVKTIKAMAEVGVDVVKVQNDKADGGVTINCNKEPFQVKGGTLWDGETLYSLYTKTDTPSSGQDGSDTGSTNTPEQSESGSKDVTSEETGKKDQQDSNE